MGRGRGKRDKSKIVDEVESARLVKHSYQLRTPTHSSKATSIALKSVPARHNSDSADGSDEVVDHLPYKTAMLKSSDILNISNESGIEKSTKTKHDNLKECLKLKLRLIKLDKSINCQFNNELTIADVYDIRRECLEISEEISSIQLGALESGVEEYQAIEQELTGLVEKCGKLLENSENFVQKTSNCDGDAYTTSREAFATETKNFKTQTTKVDSGPSELNPRATPYNLIIINRQPFLRQMNLGIFMPLALRLFSTTILVLN